MATFKIEWTYYVEDVVSFIDCEGKRHIGVVQSVHDLPDIWVECWDDGTYRRYRLGIDSICLENSEHEDSGSRSKTTYGKSEKIEFVHKGEFGTKEFEEISYI